LQALRGEADVLTDRRQCDIDDRCVDEVEEPGQADQGEREPAATGGEERRLFGGA
jgi:hypothetical protein